MQLLSIAILVLSSDATSHSLKQGRRTPEPTLTSPVLSTWVKELYENFLDESIRILQALIVEAKSRTASWQHVRTDLCGTDV